MITGDMEQYLGSSSGGGSGDLVEGRGYWGYCDDSLCFYLHLISVGLSYIRGLDMLAGVTVSTVKYSLTSLPENLDRYQIQSDVQQCFFIFLPGLVPCVKFYIKFYIICQVR